MSNDQKKIASIYRELDANAKSSLLDFAEFLLSRSKSESASDTASKLQVPVSEPVPESETVIAALKRMRRVYPMLETEGLFNEASSLVSSNLIGGRPSREVVVEIELLFAKYYRKYANPSVVE